MMEMYTSCVWEDRGVGIEKSHSDNEKIDRAAVVQIHSCLSPLYQLRPVANEKQRRRSPARTKHTRKQCSNVRYSVPAYVSVRRLRNAAFHWTPGLTYFCPIVCREEQVTARLVC